MSKPKYKIGQFAYITLNGRKPSKREKPQKIVAVYEHAPPIPSTNYYGVRTKGKFVYALEDYQPRHGWLFEEEITRPPIAQENTGDE